MRAIVLAIALAACATEPATSTATRPIIDVKDEMCRALTGLTLEPDGECPAADIRCTPRRCCTGDWEYCCVGVPGPDGPIVVCG